MYKIGNLSLQLNIQSSYEDEHKLDNSVPVIDPGPAWVYNLMHKAMSEILITQQQCLSVLTKIETSAPKMNDWYT
jgi:hypothetical protein